MSKTVKDIKEDTKKIKQCKVENCTLKPVAHGYCMKHDRQIRRYGHVKERTLIDKNKFIIEDDCVKIELYNRKCEIDGYAIVDKEDYEKVKNMKWHLNKTGNMRVCTANKKICTSLAHLVLGAKKGYRINYKDVNIFNCRKSNLDSLDNKGITKRYYKNNTGYKGVTELHVFITRIRVNGCVKHIGTFKTAKEAAKAYNDAVIKYYDGKGYLNKV